MSSAAREAVLIVTRQDAQEVDGVIDILRASGCQVVRWNVCRFPSPEHLTLSGPGPRSAFSKIPIGAGWLHETQLFSVTSSLSPSLEREVALAECGAFLQGAVLRADCNWLNDPRVIPTATNKPFQLHVAASLGIRVPNYVITNDAKEITEFALTVNSVVLKSLASAFIRAGPKQLKFYSRRLREVPVGIEPMLSFGPVIAQREIEKIAELRVTVVDDRAFVVRVDCSGDEVPVDLRRMDFATDRWRFSASCEFAEVVELSKMLMRRLGLNFGGLDWLVDREGHPYFLECNALASFKWYEIVGQFPVTEAIADALLRRCHL